MANRYRGEISAVLDGTPYKLCLTLGALAELETLFGAEDMVALATRFENGRISARDAHAIIAAGLRGGGTDMSDDAVKAMKVDDAAAGYIEVVAKLLRATFGSSDERPSDQGPGVPGDETKGPSGEGGPISPFRGTT